MKEFKLFGNLILIGIFSATLQAQPNATLSARAGIVEILRTGAWQPAESGDAIVSGERIRTGSRSSAALQLASGKVVTLSEKTEVELSDVNGSPGLKVQTGHMKVVSDGSVETEASNTAAQVSEPSNTELDRLPQNLNITVITGGMQDSAPFIRRATPVVAPPAYGTSLFPNSNYPTYYVYPYFSYGNPGLIQNNLRNPYSGIRPGQIVPPMTDPLRPPVHFPR